VVIKARGLKKSFEGTQGKIQVLNGLDVSVPRGEVLSIIGASGVGKSTLLQILGSLDHADAGTLEIGGKRVDALSGRELNGLRNRYIGFVFQFHFLLPEFTALENVMMPGLVGRRSWKASQGRAEELLVRVGLADRLHHKPSELSGGEQQRVAVARALANEPEVILADEPTGNLDDASSAGIHELMGQLARDERKTFVVVTHKRDFADYAHRVALLSDGVLRQIRGTDASDV
jgi:lipoprotein-releasing system ATP-binding protein